MLGTWVCQRIQSDTYTMQLLREVECLNLPSAWVAAGAIRQLIWDECHHYSERTPLNDVDVVYFDPTSSEMTDVHVESYLRKRNSSINWQVKNQARMYIKNGHMSYKNVGEAMSYWPETATAVAAQRDEWGSVQLLAPYGVSDLVQLLLRQSSKCKDATLFMNRIKKKKWLERWPQLRIVK
ncbi:nitrate reductase [Pullulanibacillus camelliae]|uniref:Nitrate reductase n=1 Tax=Pullulanibacillus camelliae TaxID=1707096 RepID=A0A8J2VT12_9BACL|nr:nucleotidyltransferase family protein [Pullulanibacillus camelliae]GGE39770.1 nitrate reductase [Pullulanibacillus camelliae]